MRPKIIITINYKGVPNYQVCWRAQLAVFSTAALINEIKKGKNLQVFIYVFKAFSVLGTQSL
jgi:hypothetical protein